MRISCKRLASPCLVRTSLYHSSRTTPPTMTGSKKASSSSSRTMPSAEASTSRTSTEDDQLDSPPTSDNRDDGAADGSDVEASASAEGSRPRMPKLICFDLDYTLWPLWVDTHVTPPLKRKGAQDINLIYDRYQQEMAFYKDVPEILVQLKNDPDVHVAIASRTHAPKAAEQALDQLLIPEIEEQKRHRRKEAATSTTRSRLIRAMECFDTKEIYPGSKLTHFKALHRKTNIPYEEMVFYDDESRNREVASLGVTFVLVPEGVNRRIFEKGLQDWRDARDGKTSNVFIERRKK